MNICDATFIPLPVATQPLTHESDHDKWYSPVPAAEDYHPEPVTENNI